MRVMSALWPFRPRSAFGNGDSGWQRCVLVLVLLWAVAVRVRCARAVCLCSRVTRCARPRTTSASFVVPKSRRASHSVLVAVRPSRTQRASGRTHLLRYERLFQKAGSLRTLRGGISLPADDGVRRSLALLFGFQRPFNRSYSVWTTTVHRPASDGTVLRCV